ncbi:hypothetical protein [Actibacterium pelagium]|uniref:Uncharacterized protein n=1 Tax=Actibacterium pelagium TaxID=2029103 RepID=A0A917AF81_9RHOB|nr:hypothetical protein [Actibacterium pelagium]GGE44166.1 hypothetical protein GCM10011517_09760 [Actibacterium pelagium]
MKTISAVSVLALGMQSVWGTPVFASPVLPTPTLEGVSGSTYQIECHDGFDSETEEGSINPILRGVEKLYFAGCDDTTGDDKPTSPKETREVTRSIETVNDRCDDVPLRLRIDCIAQRYEILAQSPDLTGEYSEVQEALQSAASRLRALAEEAGEPGGAKERLTVERNGKATPVGRPLTPTSPAKQAEAFAAAIQIIEETETMLLRSAGTSKRRQVSYQRIAQAMGSNKVLLRS